MNSGTARKLESLFADGSATEVAVLRMLTRVFSSYLCMVPPRKFCTNGIFNLFPEEVCRVNIGDLRDENGGQVPMSCFNRGARGTDAFYAGTAFAVLTGNLCRKDPGKGEFFKSSLFERLRKVVNSVELVSGADECESSSSTQSSLKNSSDSSADTMDDLLDPSAKDSSLFSRAEEDVRASKNLIVNHSPKSPPNTIEIPPKCSTPAHSSCSSTVSSPSTSPRSLSPNGSLSSVTEIESSFFGPVTKKRKIRKKVETVMGDITNLCSDNGETLSELIAQCCLFQRKDNFAGRDIVRSIFERVEKQRGVRKTCKELIPEELWQKGVDEMCVPDWILVLCKLESRISDDSWQTILNRTRLGKSGVSCILIPFIIFYYCHYFFFLFNRGFQFDLFDTSSLRTLKCFAGKQITFTLFFKLI